MKNMGIAMVFLAFLVMPPPIHKFQQSAGMTSYQFRIPQSHLGIGKYTQTLNFLDTSGTLM